MVLSERALELTPLTEEIETISGPALLRDVHFFAGDPPPLITLNLSSHLIGYVLTLTFFLIRRIGQEPRTSTRVRRCTRQGSGGRISLDLLDIIYPVLPYPALNLPNLTLT